MLTLPINKHSTGWMGLSKLLSRSHWLSRLADVQTQVSGRKYPKATFFSWFPVRRIDHIFVSSHLSVQSVLVPGTYQARRVSDHLPVCTRLSLNADLSDSGKGLAK